MGVIPHIIVVGFHHAHGPIVEYAYPPFPGQTENSTLQRLEVPEEWSLLPFLALPDGSHQSDEDFTYFHLPPAKGREDSATTLFGISCNRQILTKDLDVKSDDMTRSSVQKAVVVLATQPIFGVLRQRLGVVTAAWFGQKDFSQTDILKQFYASLDATIATNIPDSAFMMGTSLRELVKKFKYKVLVLLKLLLLEKRTIFFGYPIETLCTYQYSLISLVPGLLKALQDTGSPSLDSSAEYTQRMSKTPAHSTNKQELFQYLGLPLHIFGKGAFFQPYLPLQQIDILQDARTFSYIVGTSNAIFLQNRDCGTDVVVNIEPGTIDFVQQDSSLSGSSLSTILSLTTADKRWMDEIIEAVNHDDGSGEGAIQTEYAGSDDYLRAKFEEYILTLLSSVKHSQNTHADDAIDAIGNAQDRNLTADYGVYFVREWQRTTNYQLWNDYVDWELLNELVAPGHPCQGNFSLMDVQRRLTNQLKDMRIDKNLAPLKQSFSKAMTSGRTRLTNVFDTVWQEFEKLQPEEDPLQESLRQSQFSPKNDRKSLESTSLVQSESTHPVPPSSTRLLEDPNAPVDEHFDAVVPVKKNVGSTTLNLSPTTVSKGSGSLWGGDWTTSSSKSSPSAPANDDLNGNNLGPVTAATAALGQKAAGMFSNVSSFFNAKKKELIKAQQDAEEQYQQRILQHERKQKMMRDRAKATASTFAVSSVPSPTLKSPRASAFPSGVNQSGSTTEEKDGSTTTSASPEGEVTTSSTTAAAVAEAKDFGNTLPRVKKVESPKMRIPDREDEEPSLENQQLLEDELREALKSGERAKSPVPDATTLVVPADDVVVVEAPQAGKEGMNKAQ